MFYCPELGELELVRQVIEPFAGIVINPDPHKLFCI
jgi:hypothetical protein